MEGREAAAAQVTREQGRLEGGSEGEEEDTRRGRTPIFYFLFLLSTPRGGGSRMKYLNNKVLVS